MGMAGTGTDANKATRFWRVFSAKPHIVAAMSECNKAGEIVLVMVAGSDDDERGSAMDSLTSGETGWTNS